MNRIRRAMPLAWVLGAAALGFSFFIASGYTGAEAQTPEDKKSVASDTPGLVCFGSVDVEGGLLQLRPPTFPQPSEVVRVNESAREGSRVAAGTVLAELDSSLMGMKVAEAKAGLAEAQAKLAEVKERKRNADLTRKHTIAQAEINVEAQESLYDAAEYKLNKLKEIEEIGRSRGTTLVKDYEIEEARLKAQAAQKAVEAARAQLDQARETVPDFSAGIAQSEAAIARYQSLVGQAEYGIDQMKITAPADGVILRKTIREGSHLGPQTQTPSFLFLPDGETFVRAEVEQEFAGRVSVGRAVKLYESKGTKPKWTGTVTRVGGAYLPERSAGGIPNPFGSGDKSLEFIVSIDVPAGESGPLYGQKLRVSVE